MSVTSPITGRVTGIVASGVTRSIGHRTRIGVPFDADALTYIAAVEAADDEALESSIKVAYNNFVKGTKADGDWDAIKASCIMAGARTLAGCLVPLVGTAPTNVGPFVSGDYNRITGLLGNGSTKCLNSNRNNNADPQDSNHNAVYVSALGTSGVAQSYIGCGEVDAGINQILQSSADNTIFFRNRSNTADYKKVATRLPGLYGKSRPSSSEFSVRSSNTQEVAESTSQSAFNGNVFIFARGTVATPLLHSDARMSFYSIGESLNLANLDTRVSALMTAIGAALA